MASELMCPHCGWKYDPQWFSEPGDDGRPFALVPTHAAMSVAEINRDFSKAVFGPCPGSEQHPRNPESDRRPLWKDLPAKEPNPFQELGEAGA